MLAILDTEASNLGVEADRQQTVHLDQGRTCTGIDRDLPDDNVRLFNKMAIARRIRNVRNPILDMRVHRNQRLELR